MRWISFGITLNETLITDMPVSSKDLLGIETEQFPIPGLVSLYEEHDARHNAGYNLGEWYVLSPMDRAMEVAMYRIRASMEYQRYKAQERRAAEDAQKRGR